MRKVGRTRTTTLGYVLSVSPAIAEDADMRAYVERKATARLGPIVSAGWLGWRAVGPARLRWLDTEYGPTLVVRQPWTTRYVGRRSRARA